MKVALYARYSTDHQRDASIEDQLRLCRLHAEKQGWTVVDSYTDRAISGASLLRAGIQELISDAMRGKFAVVLAEAMVVSPTVASNPASVSGFSKVESVDCSVLRALLNVPNAETWAFSEFCWLVN